jgi:hypothetical protein
MDNHLDIFEDIYDIKDNITDGQFLILNNKIKNLIQENKNLKEKLPNSMFQFENEEFGEEIQEQSNVVIQEQSNVVIQEQSNVVIRSTLRLNCGCSFYCSLDNPSMFGNLSHCFCLASQEQMENCENFKKLFEKVPLLQNIFHKIDQSFTEESLEQEYNKNEIESIYRILLFLFEKISEKKSKIIISFVIYDYILKNINFLKDHQRHAYAVYRKFKELTTDEDFVRTALEYNVNYKKWLDIMKSTISYNEYCFLDFPDIRTHHQNILNFLLRL